MITAIDMEFLCTRHKIKYLAFVASHTCTFKTIFSKLPD